MLPRRAGLEPDAARDRIASRIGTEKGARGSVENRERVGYPCAKGGRLRCVVRVPQDAPLLFHRYRTLLGRGKRRFGRARRGRRGNRFSIASRRRLVWINCSLVVRRCWFISIMLRVGFPRLFVDRGQVLVGFRQLRVGGIQPLGHGRQAAGGEQHQDGKQPACPHDCSSTRSCPVSLHRPCAVFHLKRM